MVEFATPRLQPGSGGTRCGARRGVLRRLRQARKPRASPMRSASRRKTAPERRGDPPNFIVSTRTQFLKPADPTADGRFVHVLEVPLQYPGDETFAQQLHHSLETGGQPIAPGDRVDACDARPPSRFDVSAKFVGQGRRRSGGLPTRARTRPVGSGVHSARERRARESSGAVAPPICLACRADPSLRRDRGAARAMKALLNDVAEVRLKDGGAKRQDPRSSRWPTSSKSDAP